MRSCEISTRMLPRQVDTATRDSAGVWPRQEGQRRHLTEAVVGPLGVVELKPGLGDLGHVVEGVEEMRVERRLAIAAVEAFAEGILIRRSRLNVSNGDPVRRAPFHEGLRRELGAVVDAPPGRAAVPPDELVEPPEPWRPGDRRPDLDRQGFAMALIEHVEGAEAAGRAT